MPALISSGPTCRMPTYDPYLRMARAHAWPVPGHRWCPRSTYAQGSYAQGSYAHASVHTLLSLAYFRPACISGQPYISGPSEHSSLQQISKVSRIPPETIPKAAPPLRRIMLHGVMPNGGTLNGTGAGAPLHAILHQHASLSRSTFTLCYADE